MLHYINNYIRERSYPPSIGEIGAGVELKFISTVKVIWIR
ncbi:hypothetical protein [Domibacillus antri]